MDIVRRLHLRIQGERIAHFLQNIEPKHGVTAGGEKCGSNACGARLQRLAQRAASASSLSRAGTQWLPSAVSSVFQNGALVLR